MTEEELVKRLQENDRSAREELYQLFAPTMFSLCLRYFSSREDAEDALQDGFIQVFTAIEKFTFRGQGSLAAWIHRVFTNFVIGRLREMQHAIIEDVKILPDLVDEDPPPPHYQHRRFNTPHKPTVNRLSHYL